MKHLLLLAFVVGALPFSGTTTGAAVIAKTCDYNLAQHYRLKGAKLANNRDYRDALDAFDSSIQAVNSCSYVSPVWGYYALLLEASVQSALGYYDNAEVTFRNMKPWRARIVPKSLSATDRVNLVQNDQKMARLETYVRQRLVAIETYNASVRKYHASLARYRAQQQAAADHSAEHPVSSGLSPTYSVGEPTCEDETIDEVTEDGKAIKMLNGAFFLVNDIDVATTSIWLSTDDVKACSDDGVHYKLIDDHDDVSATKIQP